MKKGYFSLIGGEDKYPNGLTVPSTERLAFNPAWNSYRKPTLDGFLQNDMAAMFAPTDAAMDKYLNSGKGIVLKDRYGSWDNVPQDIVAIFLRRHFRISLLASLPSRFDSPVDSVNSKINDSENSPIKIRADHVKSAYIGVNGVVYSTSEVYPPDDYVSIYGPVLFSENTKIFNWIIQYSDFRLYLNSLISRYSMFVPTDEFFDGYIDPIAVAQGTGAAFKYVYDEDEQAVYAVAYEYSAETNEIGDSIGYFEDAGFVADRLLDILDNHIVVGDVEDANGYHLTKGGNYISIEGADLNMTIRGGGETERDDNVSVTKVFPQENGKTYFIDKPIQTASRSVYDVLSKTDEFSAFYNLCSGFDSSSDTSIFIKGANKSGVDFNVKFLNTYNLYHLRPNQ